MPKCPRHKTELVKISELNTFKKDAKILYRCDKCKKISDGLQRTQYFDSHPNEDKKFKLSYQWCIDSDKNMYFYYGWWHLFGKSNGETFIFR